MDRDSLEAYLQQGLSLAEIGRRVRRHEATVAYWVAKHGLVATNRGRHLARGGLDREILVPLVEAGMTIEEIAARVGRSKTTVRHWLVRHGLRTTNRRGRRHSPEASEALRQGLRVTTLECPRHRETAYVIDSRGYYRCRRCRAERVSRRRRKLKTLLVAEAGGGCCICGYADNVRALHFHHVDPTTKRLELNAKGVALSLETLRAEAQKCVLLCSNCHAEVEAGAAPVPENALRRVFELSRPGGLG